MECGAGGCGGKGVRVCIAYRRLSCARHAHGSRRFGIGAVDARGPRATRRLITLWSAPGGFPEFWRMTFLISARLMLLCLLDWPRRAPLSSLCTPVTVNRCTGAPHANPDPAKGSGAAPGGVHANTWFKV